MTELMLELAGVSAGAQVLDIAAGTGEQSLEAARRAGETGSVLATDISAAMLEVCARNAESAGLNNVRTHVLRGEDVGTLEAGRFDAVISRFGLMFISELDRALAGCYGVLRSGGRLAAVVWASAEENPYIGSPLLALRELGAVGALDDLAMVHELAGERLPDALRTARFQAVESRSVPVVRHFADAAEAVRMIKSSPAVAAAVERLEPRQRESVWSSVEKRYAGFASERGVTLPGLAIVAAGTRP